MTGNSVDIKENDILSKYPSLLKILLKDRTSKKNIIWATDTYAIFGDGYQYQDEILIGSITGENGMVIRPRARKSKEEQNIRIKEKAEVFTPLWICNKQNNLVDAAWFGVDEVFNKEVEKGWETIDRPIPFPTKDGKTWQDYIHDRRLEITCGEAPYLASRYEVITGQAIAAHDRIGLLDRKLRVISENTKTIGGWHKWAVIAYKSIYGYEWQGDSILLARETLLYTYIDYYTLKFRREPNEKKLIEIARILAWNIWQMDGLKGVIPNSCHTRLIAEQEMFEGVTTKEVACVGCQKNDIHKHNGIYCKIKDWRSRKTISYISLLK